MEYKPSEQSYLFGVILAGGSGSRLWPLSRESYPKHFLRLLGSQSLLQTTISRIEKILPPQNIFLVANQKYLIDIKTQLDFFEKENKNRPLENFILEPIGRNTAPAIGLAALRIYEINPESIMVVLPSDHQIKDEGRFLELIKYSLNAAVKGYLVTFGIKPEYPETGYGYIKKGALIDRSKNNFFETFLADGFYEKPDKRLAEEYFESKSFLWNSGIFVFKTKEILRAIKKFQPQLFNSLVAAYNLSPLPKNSFADPEIEKIYGNISPMSIDKAVMEKSDKVCVIPSDFGWSDVGSWDKIHQILPKDKEGNFIDKKVISFDCKNSLIFGNNRVIAGLGLEDIIVVDSDDALLVCHKNKTQEVKHIFNALKNNNIKESLEPKTTIRPWGAWTVLLEGPKYKIKKFIVNPGQSLSKQMHNYRSEHWVVINGQAQVDYNEKTAVLEKGQSVFIPAGTKHRVSNLGQNVLEIIEIQNGDYIGEDDIVRFDDEYGRT